MNGEHPNPIVSQSAATMLIAAGETRNVSTLKHMLALATALSCPNEVIVAATMHGSARLSSMPFDHVTIAPWNFHRVSGPNGQALWTFDVDTTHLQQMYEKAEEVGQEADDFDRVLAELHRTGRTLCTGANDFPDLMDEHGRVSMEDVSKVEDEILSHWPDDEDARLRWVGIARLIMCIAEFTYAAAGQESGFGQHLDED